MDQRLPGTGAVTFKLGISTLSLPELSDLSARHKEQEESGEERGGRGPGRGRTHGVRDGGLVEEMDGQSGHRRQEMEEEVREGR